MFALAGLVSPAAMADPDHVLCLSDRDPGPTPTCLNIPCGTIHLSLQSALDEAAGLLNIGGERPEVHLCLGVGANDDGQLWTGSLSVDNRGGAYGDPLVFHLARPMCPSPESLPSQPLLEVATDGMTSIAGPLSDMNSCPSGSRPGVSLWGGGTFSVNSPDLRGWEGYGVANGLAGSPGGLSIGEGAISSGTGTAIRSSGPLGISEMEFVGNRTGGSSALVLLDRDSERLGLADSTFYGNLVDEGADGLIVGSPVALQNATVVANAIVGSTPLVQSGGVWPDYEAVGPGAAGGVQNSTFARNRWLAEAPVTMPNLEPAEYPRPGESGCGGIPATEYHLLPHPFAGVGPGPSASVVRIAAQYAEVADPDEGLLFLIGRSFFLDNQGATPLHADSPGRNTAIVLVHNTFADSTAGPILRASADENTSVTLLRNLAVDGGDEPLVEFLTPIRSFVSSMNAGGSDDGIWAAPKGLVEFELMGPQVIDIPLGFLDPTPLRGLSACARHAAVCPDVDPEDCAVADGTWWECAPDLAAEFMPDPATVEALSAPWPWDTTWFHASDSVVSGASGWRCKELHGTFDRSGSEGDFDGFPDAVDCFNEDPERWPSLPEHDGYTSPYCDAEEVDCYICPEGSLPLPADDDDAADDDDLADDDDSAPPPPGRSRVQEGCVASGCGVSYTCQDGVAAAILPFLCLPFLPWRRRRT